jgi:hypothetical protein
LRRPVCGRAAVHRDAQPQAYRQSSSSRKSPELTRSLALRVSARSSTPRRCPRPLPTMRRSAGADGRFATKGAVCSQPADSRRPIELDDDQKSSRGGRRDRDPRLRLLAPGCARYRVCLEAAVCDAMRARREFESVAWFDWIFGRSPAWSVVAIRLHDSCRRGDVPTAAARLAGG